MSSFITLAKRPGGTKYEECCYLDDFYGHHQYGVRFLDGEVYPEAECTRISRVEEDALIDAASEDPITEGFNKLYHPEPETFTQGQLDQYATECLETERKRIHGILSRVLVEDVKVWPDSEVQKILDKCILGNRK